MRLLALAVAIVSAAAFAADTPTTTSSAPAPAAHRGPQLIIKDADPKAPAPVTLAKADITVAIAGPLAQTTTILTFHNSTARVLEGELEFPLPENAAVTGYGLDVNGVLVDGVPVEKQRARQIFESEVRKGVDPGILEQTKGNNFKTRLYPIPANGDRTVKITYISDLPAASGKATYSLPLDFPAAIKDVNLAITATGTPDAPQLAGLPGLKFESAGPAFAARKSFHDIELAGSLAITVTAPKDGLTLIETRDKPFTVDELANPSLRKNAADAAEYYFLATVPPPPTIFYSVITSSRQRIALYWDASLSREKADKTAELEFIKQLAANLKNVTIDVVTFRNTTDIPVEFVVADGDATALLKHLETLAYDGATDLAGLKFVKNAMSVGLPRVFKDTPPNYAYALLFTDGLATLGTDLPTVSPIPVFTIAADTRADFATLRYIAASSPAGAFLNLQRTKPADAVAALSGNGLKLLSITADDKQITDIFPRGARPASELLTVTGRLLAPEATLTLNYGVGTTITTSTKLTLKRDAATASSGLVSRFWAQQKVADLSALPDKNADELLALGRSFNMVTPNTSLMVLERVEQYLQYRIVPPKTHPDLYKAFISRIEEEGRQQKTVDEAKINRVLALWQARLDWYKTDFKPTKEQLAAIGKVAKDAAGRIQHPQLGLGETSAAGGSAGGGLSPSSPAPGAADHPVADPQHAATPAPSVHSSAAQTGHRDEALARDGGTISRERVLGVEQTFGALASDKDEKTGEALPATSVAGRITLKEWDPNTPYLKALKAAPAEKAYATYLEQRKTFGSSPAFFLDCADFFLKAKENELAIRILSNIAELKLESAPLLRIAAYRFLQIKQLDLAIDLFEKARHLRPDEPQSDRDLALALAARGKLRYGFAIMDGDPTLLARIPGFEDLSRALQLYHHVVMNPWERFPEIEVIALMEANSLWADIQRLPQFSFVQTSPHALRNPFDPRLTQNLPCDLRIVMTWDADNTDIDLHVIEPTNEECDYSHNRTLIGGLVSHDFTDGYGPEEYCIKKALPGNYKIRAHYYGSRQQTLAGPVTVQATLITNFGRPDESRQSLTLRLATQNETVDIGAAKIGP